MPTLEEYGQIVIRPPKGMREQIKADAAANGRSMNAEIVARISQPQNVSLRDWFAGQATEDDIAAHTIWKFNDDLPVDYPPAPDCTREQAKYRYADAMLAAREASHG